MQNKHTITSIQVRRISPFVHIVTRYYVVQKEDIINFVEVKNNKINLY
jgi:bifunctional N-acetylglucosamine-1-phosphate-uridyltransferase/glucosamine-1-phosphate-acetyltransferase GlmU-like protein